MRVSTRGSFTALPDTPLRGQKPTSIVARYPDCNDSQPIPSKADESWQHKRAMTKPAPDSGSSGVPGPRRDRRAVSMMGGKNKPPMPIPVDPPMRPNKNEGRGAVLQHNHRPPKLIRTIAGSRRGGTSVYAGLGKPCRFCPPPPSRLCVNGGDAEERVSRGKPAMCCLLIAALSRLNPGPYWTPPVLRPRSTSQQAEAWPCRHGDGRDR